ncbi:MAG: hypothetical protein HYX67_17615 [Candidatus Melainabacteria bacterium]|nr:hypothetical protein [Candidatus Melainabacteria bacterium]
MARKRPSGRRIYTDEDRAKVYAELEASGGNIKGTARVCGFPPATVRAWKRGWAEFGVPAPVMEAVPRIAADFISTAVRVRDKMLDELERQNDDAQLKGKDLVSGIAMLTDKIRIYQGLPTSKQETNVELPTPSRVRELFSGVFEEVVSSARKRAEEIKTTTEAEWESAESKGPLLYALPKAQEE